MLFAVCLTLFSIAGCGSSNAADNNVVVHFHDETITGASIRGSTLILKRKLQVPAWAEAGTDETNDEVWVSLDRVAVKVDSMTCPVSRSATEMRDCVKFDGLADYDPIDGGLKSMSVDHVTIKVSNRKLYDKWMKAIEQAREKSMVPMIQQ
ncbi:MAG TPA: hypothetical protein VNG29_00980 [Candidatus Paceibacterota bacterium]|nr:hypothetical protein [Candidatus Paceibacterota bacterium]